MKSTANVSLKYAVVGTGCCGTVAMARQLTRAGLPCTHEAIFGHDGYQMGLSRLSGEAPIQNSETSLREGNWLSETDTIVAESSYLAVPFLGHPALKSVTVIHLVRQPLSVISSFVLDLDYFCPKMSTREVSVWNRFIYEHLPDLRDHRSAITRAAKFYVDWNRMVEAITDDPSRNSFFHRIEDDPTAVLDFLGVKDPQSNYIINRRSNSKGKRNFDFTPSDIDCPCVRAEFIDMSCRYGYDLTRAKRGTPSFL